MSEFGGSPVTRWGLSGSPVTWWGGGWQVTLLEVFLRCRSSCDCSFPMVSWLVPAEHAGDGSKAKGKPSVRRTPLAKIKAKRRGTVFANFCKNYFAQNGGGHAKLKEAALAWAKLSPKEKAKHADPSSEEKASGGLSPPIAAEPLMPPHPRRQAAASPRRSTTTSAWGTTRWCRAKLPSGRGRMGKPWRWNIAVDAAWR